MFETILGLIGISLIAASIGFCMAISLFSSADDDKKRLLRGLVVVMIVMWIALVVVRVVSMT